MISAIVLAAALVGQPVGMGLAISPAQVVGQPVSSAQFLYTDRGTTNEHVTVSPVNLNRVMFKGKVAWVPVGVASYATVSPASFNLKPGQKQVIRVSMNATDGKIHNVAIMATADGHSTVTGGRISASVGARYIVTAPTSKPSNPILPIGGAVVLAAIVGALLAILRSRRARRSEA